jgi:hypothetical protein
MPRVDPPDDDRYKELLDEFKSAIIEEVHDSEWLVKCLALAAAYTTVTTTQVLLVKQLFAEGATVTLVSAIVVMAIFIWFLFKPFNATVNLTAAAVLYKLRHLLYIPIDLEDRNIVAKAIWSALLTTIQTAASLGVGLVGAELVKNANL